MARSNDSKLTAEELAGELTGANPPGLGSLPTASARSVEKGRKAGAGMAEDDDDIDRAQIPTALSQLNAAFNQSYDLTVTAAADLSIPVVGSVGGSMNRRVVVLERVAYRTLTGRRGTEYQFGYTIRLCVTVNKWDANMKVSLPFLAASAEMGQIQASWILQVLGVAGTKIDEVAVPPTELNVETFVLAKQSLAALIAAVNDSTTTFDAYLLSRKLPGQQRDEELRKASARTYALSRIARRSSLRDALHRLGSTDARVNGSIEDVYDGIAPGAPEARPSEAAALKSRELLAGIEADA